MRHDLLDAFADAELDVLVVWGPFLASDSRAAAEAAAVDLAGSRVRQFWDPDHAVATALGPSLALDPPGLAWDVYLFYAPSATPSATPSVTPSVTWAAQPPRPDAWAHQLAAGADEHYYGAALGEMLGASGRRLLERAARGPSAAADDTPAPAERLLFDPDDVRPLPELLLEDVLSEIRSHAAAAQLDEASWEALRGAVSDGFARRCAEHGALLPRAVRWQGRILNVVGPGCSDEAPAVPGDRR